MSAITVLKFGSSVLHSPRDIPGTIHDIYAQWRERRGVIAVVSAFAGVTDGLFEEGRRRGLANHALADFVAGGERESARELTLALRESGIPARAAGPAEIGLQAHGAPLEATPQALDVESVHRALAETPVIVVPGFIATDEARRTVLLGRGGSDLSALFLAQRLGARCRLLKDVDGVYDHDPADPSAVAHRYERLSWQRALEVGGELVQPRAIRFAESRGFEFEVATPGARNGTRIGACTDRLAPSTEAGGPLRIVLLGLGTVGLGVYEHLLQRPDLFAVRRVVVRDTAKPRAVTIPGDRLSANLQLALDEPADVVIETLGGVDTAADALRAALLRQRIVVTANKAVVATRWKDFARYAAGPRPRLRFSAAVGGALPVLEALAALRPRVRRVRAVINGTCNYILDALESGKSFATALADAQAAGFAESDPSDDLRGIDAARKLQLISHAAFGDEAGIAVDIAGLDGVRPADVIDACNAGNRLRLVAECELHAQHGTRPGHVTARVRPEALPESDFLAGARAEENRVEIHTTSAVVRLAGKGAGRWPTALAVMGDLYSVLRERSAQAPGDSMADDSFPAALGRT